MLTAAIIAAFPVLALAAHLFGAESRPDFLDLRKRHDRFI
jgi:hypothetical protein